MGYAKYLLIENVISISRERFKPRPNWGWNKPEAKYLEYIGENNRLLVWICLFIENKWHFTILTNNKHFQADPCTSRLWRQAAVCVPHICRVLLCVRVLWNKQPKGNKYPQTVQDPLLRTIFSWRRLSRNWSFIGCVTVTDTLKELLLAEYNVGQTARHPAAWSAMQIR